MRTRANRLAETIVNIRFSLFLLFIGLTFTTEAIAQLRYIKIIEGVTGNGTELGAKSLTADQTLTIHAAGYDASGNYLGDELVAWSVSGGIGTLNATIGTTTTLDAQKAGSGLITANHETATGDTSGTITVSAGSPHHVKILSGASGATMEVTAVTMTSGEILVIHAGSFDADDNYAADVSVAWSLSGGIGTLSVTTGIATTFTAIAAGTGLINADHATLLDDATGTIIVAPGPLSHVKVVEGASGNGPELGARSLTTDQTLTVHAAGYDASGNYVGDQIVNWSMTGGIGTLAPVLGTSTTLDAKVPGTGVITADHINATDDASGPITVLAGPPYRVKILSGASGATAEVGAETIISGQTLIVHASGFDADDNYLADVSVTWSVSGGIGTLNPTTSVSTIFTATNLGSGVITADHPVLLDDATGTITVTAGELSYIKIIEGSSGSGPELGEKIMTTDQTLTIHAAGYDAGGNYLGDQSVRWNVSSSIGAFTPTAGTATAFEARAPGIGVISADHATAADDVSGTITVSLGAAHRIKILTGAIGVTSEVGNVALLSGQTLTVHAGSFDADDNYITDVSVTWSLNGGIGILNVTTGATTTFTATATGNGIITADHSTLIDDATGIITVNGGALSYVKIVEGAAGNGPELGAKSLTTDQTFSVHAAGYDAGGNYLGDHSVVWSVSGGIGTLSPTTGTATTTLDATTPGGGFITADHPTATDDVSGIITVTVGAPRHIKVLAGASGATPEIGAVSLLVNQTLVVHASSFDADQNRIADISVGWSVSGGIGAVSPISGSATMLSATNAGSGVITADHPTLIDDATGIITVNLSTTVSSDPVLPGGTPKDFQLLQNHPNPFRAGFTATRISYELPAASLIKIAVYNLNGQLMRSLFEGPQSAGRYVVSWNGQTHSGEPAASGVYLIRMEADKFVATRKIVVAR
jgi:hypothetical protein